MDMFVREEDRVVIMMRYELKWRAIICEIRCQKIYGFVHTDRRSPKRTLRDNARKEGSRGRAEELQEIRRRPEESSGTCLQPSNSPEFGGTGSIRVRVLPDQIRVDGVYVIHACLLGRVQSDGFFHRRTVPLNFDEGNFVGFADGVVGMSGAFKTCHDNK